MAFFGIAPVAKAINRVPLTDRHKGERILIRKTGDKLYASLALEDGVAHQNVYVLNPSKGISAYALLGLLCSRAASFLYRGSPLGQKGRPMAQLRLAGIEGLPIPNSFVSSQSQLEEVSRQIATANAISSYAQLNLLVYKLYDFSENDILLSETVCADIGQGL